LGKFDIFWLSPSAVVDIAGHIRRSSRNLVANKLFPKMDALITSKEGNLLHRVCIFVTFRLENCLVSGL
jgi:hypothetical protein